MHNHVCTNTHTHIYICMHPLKTQVASLADPVVFKMLPNSKTGYLRLAEFNARAPLSMKHAIQELEKEVRRRGLVHLYFLVYPHVVKRI